MTILADPGANPAAAAASGIGSTGVDIAAVPAKGSRVTTEDVQVYADQAKQSATAEGGEAVTFYSDGTRLGSVPVYAVEPGRGEAALVTLTLPIGAHEITARFTGASGFSGSQASPLTLTVVR